MTEQETAKEWDNMTVTLTLQLTEGNFKELVERGYSAEVIGVEQLEDQWKIIINYRLFKPDSTEVMANVTNHHATLKGITLPEEEKRHE